VGTPADARLVPDIGVVYGADILSGTFSILCVYTLEGCVYSDITLLDGREMFAFLCGVSCGITPCGLQLKYPATDVQILRR